MDVGFDMKSLSQSDTFKVIMGKASIYIGEFKDGKPEGLGVLITQRFTFEGELKIGHKVRGTEQSYEGTYKGYYLNGLRDGQGEFIWNNGEAYNGDWKNGMKHGQGRWTGPGGNSYEGSWANNKQEGEGVHLSKGD